MSNIAFLHALFNHLTLRAKAMQRQLAFIRLLMTNIVDVDCTGVTSASAFWDRYLSTAKPQGAALFGRNLDAFWDAIDGGGPGFPEQDVVHFINTDDLKRVDGGFFYEKLLELAKASRWGGVTFD